jgi:transaldolase
MTKLQRLWAEQGQSPWLDNLTRDYLNDGTLARMVSDGIRGVTSNPTIFAKAIEGSTAYDEQFSGLMARDTAGTITAARDLHQRVAEPNLLVKIPATPEGVPAIEAMIAEGRSINITLIFSLSRYAEVIEAYQRGLEKFAASGGDPSRVHSVASFFVSRVDTEVDSRLEAIGSDRARSLRGRAAVAQARLAYRLFGERFSGPRWDRLAASGGTVQRPLWASTSTKNPVYPDTLYVDDLIGPNTVNTLPEKTIAAFEDHGQVARTIDTGLDEADEVMAGLASVGIDMEDVATVLEERGVDSFHDSFQEVLEALEAKARALALR